MLPVQPRPLSPCPCSSAVVAEDFYMQKTTWNPNPSTTCSTENSSTVVPSSSSSDSFSRNSVKYLEKVKKKLAVKMDLVFETCLAQDTDFPVCDSPVWVFGRSYSIHYGKDRDGKDIDELRRTVGTCLWLTYRKNFPGVGDTALSSDRGWGCMIRAGQMVIAKSLLLRHLGPDWHWERHTRDPAYLQIVSLFADTRAAPLSLHQIAQSGASLGKSVGSWLGPNTVAQALKRLMACDSMSMDLQIYIAMDSSLVKSEVKRACLISQTPVSFQSPGSVPVASFNTPRVDPKWKPLLLVVPLRLGLSDLNPSYVPAFKAAFEVKQNVGIIGGRPNHALYFIGYAEDEILFLDPHTVQPAVTVGSKIFDTEKLADETYHIHKPGRMPFAAMDPSIAVCFYCKSEDDFDLLCSKLSDRFLTTPLPLFEICERRPHDWSEGSAATTTTLPAASSIGGKSSSKKGNVSPSNSFTKLGFTKSSSPRSTSLSQHSRSSAGSSPSSSTGRKSDLDDEEFEILG